MKIQSTDTHIQFACYQAGTNRQSILGIFDCPIREDVIISEWSESEIDEAIRETKECIAESLMNHYDCSRKEIEITAVPFQVV